MKAEQFSNLFDVIANTMGPFPESPDISASVEEEERSILVQVKYGEAGGLTYRHISLDDVEDVDKDKSDFLNYILADIVRRGLASANVNPLY